MAKYKPEKRKLAEMSAIERFIAGCSNPSPVAKPRIRYAAMVALTRRV